MIRYPCTVAFVAISLAFLRCAGAAPAQQLPDFSKAQVKTQKVAGSVYMITGAGGNIGVSVGDDGLLMVDAEYPQMGDKVKAALEQLSNKPIRYLINTHWHLDHASGDAYYAKLGAVIVAQENVRRILASGTMRDGIKYPPTASAGLPTLTYGDHAAIQFNGEEVRLIHLPNAHTDGDTVVYFAGSDVIHMGDNYRTDGFPLVDQDNGGTVQGMIQGLSRIIDSFPPTTKVIPGHGALPMTVADIKPFLEMLLDCKARVSEGIRQGKTADQMKQGKILTGYEKYSGLVSMDRFTDMLYRELTSPAAQPAR